MASLVLSKLTDILLSAKTTLPTLMNAIGAPGWMIGLLVPIRESGSLLPQALFSAWLSRRENRRTYWVTSMAIQTACIVTLIYVPLLVLSSLDFVNNAVVGGLVLVSLLVLSLARAMTSLTMKDIQGVHIAKGMRGNLVGIASTAAGVLSLLFASLSFLSTDMSEHILMIIGVVCVASMLLCIATLVSLKTKVKLKDEESNSDLTKHNLDNKDAFSGPSTAIIRQYLNTFTGELGRFILVRAMFVHTALIAPFYIVWATNLLPQNRILTLSSFIIAQAGATVLSSYIWGALSDRNAKWSMQIGASIVFLLSVVIAGLNGLDVASSLHPLWFITFYFLISVGYEGARAGRKIYALDIKDGGERTEFIGKANTAIGIVIVLLGSFYSALAMTGETIVFSVMAAGLGLGLIISLGMRAEK